LFGLDDFANAPARTFLKKNEKKQSASSDSEQNCQGDQNDRQLSDEINSRCKQHHPSDRQPNSEK